MHEVWYLSHLTVPSLSLFFLFKILWAVRQTHCRNKFSFFFPGLSLKLSKWCSALLQDKIVLHSLLHVLRLRISVAATSIPLMLYSWHDRRHEIVGQMVDYTNPHYSSWWGWNLDHMNLVLHFFSCSTMLKWVLIIAPFIIPTFSPLFLWKTLFSMLSLPTFFPFF